MAAAVVAVTSPAGPLTPESPILLLANDSVVTHTPFLPWLPTQAIPGGMARVQLSTYQAVKAFMPRCPLSRIPADLAAARAVNLLTVRFEDAFWSRLLTALKAAGVFAQVRSTRQDLHDAIGLMPAPPAGGPDPLAVMDGDWHNAQACVAEPAREDAVAVAARRHLAQVRFLPPATAESLDTHTNPFPLKHLGTAASPFVECLTRTARSSEASAVRPPIVSIRTALPPSIAADGAVARRMQGLLSTHLLPPELLARGVEVGERRGEFEDELGYTRPSDGRRLIKEERVPLLGARFAAAPLLFPPQTPSTSPPLEGAPSWAGGRSFGLRASKAC